MESTARTVSTLTENLDKLHRWTFGTEGEFTKDVARQLCEQVADLVREQAASPITRENEPPVGTWVRDRHGATSYRQPAGWGEPGTVPTGQWKAMWDARGPYVICGPWGANSGSA
ncbi:hypothetical protein [Cryobacterium sp. BB736]|uniref:hypothetical protein n=1 Tax=Cryobacterium sp. BB736 TaxID=2746963 RepID=UPI00187365EE|nr:hypothetical protein [Cryobacterium sp. BB736]